MSPTPAIPVAVHVFRPGRADGEAGEDLQVGEAEVEVRAEKNQRPQRRCHHRREHLGKAPQMGVVAVVGGHDHADHEVRDWGQAGHRMSVARRRRAPHCAVPARDR